MNIKWTLTITLILTSITLIQNPSTAQTINFQILNIIWRTTANTPVYPGSINTQLRIEVKYNGSINIQACNGRLTELPKEITPSTGQGYISPARNPNGTVTTNILPGDIIYFTYQLDVNKTITPGNYKAKLIISYRAAGNIIEENYEITLTINPYPPIKISIIDAYLTPSSYPNTINTNLRITLMNKGESRITGGTIKLNLPSNFNPTEMKIQTPIIEVNEQTTVNFNDIDIAENTQPGLYTATIQLNATLQTRDGVTYNQTTMETLQIKVEPTPTNLRILSPITTQWGETRPTPTYQNTRYTALTITIMNNGGYDAQGITATVESQYLKPVKPVDTYQGRLTTGGTCTITLYYDVDPYTPSKFNIQITLSYWVDLGGGTMTKITSTHTQTINIEEMPRGGGTEIISTTWQNNINVYPNTENATLQITIANKQPYTIRGLKATLKLPNGMSGNNGEYSTTYINGPIQSYATTTIPIQISIGEIKPGKYKAKLTLEYIAETGGPGTKFIDQHEITINVISDIEAIEVINVYWMQSTVEPGTYGATLRIDIRNNYIDAMNGPIMEIKLPKGFINAFDNKSNTIKVTPVTQQAIQQLIQTPTNIQTILTLMQASTQQKQQYTRGETLTFIAPINIHVNKTGIYHANITLSYIDGWGCKRTVEETIEIPILGATKFINAEISGRINIKSRYTTLNLTLNCIGSSPAYNVYITLRSLQTNPILIATPSNIYLEKLHGEINIPIKFAYNPTASQTALGATTMINYGVIPISIQIQYRDASGNQHTYETTIAVAIEPYIDLIIKELKAELTSGNLKISGTIINYGSATAYRVKVQTKTLKTKTIGETYIGDIEAGGQAAFRIDLKGVMETEEKAEITIIYQNIFNEQYMRSIETEITKIEITTPIVKQEETPITSLHIITIAVIIFLAIIGLISYKTYRNYMRKLKLMEIGEK